MASPFSLSKKKNCFFYAMFFVIKNGFLFLYKKTVHDLSATCRPPCRQGEGQGRPCSQSLVPGDALPGRAVMPHTAPAAPRPGRPR